MKTGRILRMAVVLGAALFGSACILQMIGPNSTPGIDAATAAAGGAGPDSSAPAPLATNSPTIEPTFTLTLLPSLTFTPTQTATATIAPVTMTAGQTLSCVKGPHYILFEWVAAIPVGETVTLTARSTPEWPDYYYVRKGDGTECWAFGASSTIHGDPATLPLREAPPLPTITLVIENKTHIPIADLYIRGKNETNWGADRLGAGLIAPGASFSLSLTAGFYDVQIRDTHASILYAKEDAPIGADQNSRFISVATSINFRLVNGSPDQPICRILFIPSDLSEPFTIPIPGDGAFTPGETMTFDLLVGEYSYRMFHCVTNATIWAANGVYFGPTFPGMTMH
jgi:hypothetical protein